MKICVSVFIFLAISVMQSVYASCSDDLLNCRKTALSNLSLCNLGCVKGDSPCQNNCQSALSNDYKDCDSERTACKGASGSSSSGETNLIPCRRIHLLPHLHIVVISLVEQDVRLFIIQGHLVQHVFAQGKAGDIHV